MQIIFKELFLSGFKNHRDLQVNFGEETKISGDNTKGKSSVLEASTFLLYGTDTFGSKLDPTPVTYEADETSVSLLFSVDGKDVKLTRELKKGKAKYLVNDVPSKAGDFNEVVANLGDKDFFLSLYNPQYFFTLHKDKQRSMLLNYIPPMTTKQVLKALPGPQAEKLSELLKKHSLDDVEKIHRDNKVKMQKAHIAAESKTKTLKDQRERLSETQIDIDAVREKDKRIINEIKALEESSHGALDNNRAVDKKRSELALVQDQIEMSKELWVPLKNSKVNEHCETCGQSLDDESTTKASASIETRKSAHKEKHEELVNKKKKLAQELKDLKYIDISEQMERVKQLGNDRQELIEADRLYNQSQSLTAQIEAAEKDEQDKLSNLNDSIFILDSIKDFRSKEAELQGEKVQALFTTLSVRLFEEQKNGDIKPTFVIQMDGKDYNTLSLSESIRAGLELREVLSQQSEVLAPTFVDNAESITTFKGPTGQLITSRVVADQELKIEVSE
ncbi:AAA family ATPase [Bacillus sp. FJAT-45037]|uniref:AAA family ATPase n=1 Tax=Bacillus sp. FJAT-45037 TaxID=2011007 RepID=UPI000C2325BB|nr:AAA family ATPase [Bacillus sp. FJAT-45037]